ncbi:hypothetical protein LWI28_022579 [Acer negundo]|uniref:Integrase catalytic domain-containing protein n=1 Tax=Acer negundo TaxID=4023 RepID=A0AAD5NS40_ACENE|nr:hypothetical protein LWI28_022579 [Acer negundo]
MDFIEGLSSSGGYESILVVVDRLRKSAHFIPLRHPFTASSVAKVFVDNVVKLHGIPRSIVTDQRKLFMSYFWQELFTLQGSKLKASSSYHPETDGQTEVVNRTLKQYLRPFKVLERIGEVAYKLELPSTSRLHSVPCYCVEKRVGNPSLISSDLPAFDIEGTC